MKLLTVLMLTALPLLCSAGSGCSLLEDVINMLLDPAVSADEYVEHFQQFWPDEHSAMGVRKFKECYLSQKQETLVLDHMLMEAIYSSPWCAKY